MKGPLLTDSLDAIASLGEPTRRALYDHIAGAGDWVSRDQAADAVGLARATAAHHLDRLADDGLLEVDFKRLTGRRGPGAGRPAKVYRRASTPFEVSLPPREYELAGRLLAAAAERSAREGVDIMAALGDVARAHGEGLAAVIRALPGVGVGAGEEGWRDAVFAVLVRSGFEPVVVDDGVVVLRNCPFHELAREHTDLICGMNVCLLDAAVRDVAEAGLTARLEPEDGYCCVRLHPG